MPQSPHVHGPDCRHTHDAGPASGSAGHVHGPHCNHGPQTPVRNALKTLGRNDPCPCGSGKKYKKCHGG
ncbi:SEC-C metal-binding domain-containing protein [Modicisalibacter zincidurans]|uniref:SEC-C metal-binding domain-containing protein n=1 Tax=Modicisalibacter zincidurans TaxID=1178777 RepID=A0ABP9R4T9_9GAMM|nr:SEC-C metal-binding domain-containing protein [Halomonas zincidurans]MEA3253232.1 SEC-C metal-binding domain-containing protein [Pseudomonadota bacterium]